MADATRGQVGKRKLDSESQPEKQPPEKKPKSSPQVSIVTSKTFSRKRPASPSNEPLLVRKHPKSSESDPVDSSHSTGESAMTQENISVVSGYVSTDIKKYKKKF